MEGQLWKWTNYFYGWQQRYFILEGDELRYYDSKDQYKSNDSKFRSSIKVGRAASNIDVQGLTFVITPDDGNNIFYLQADTDGDKHKWLTKIGTARACALVIGYTLDGGNKEINQDTAKITQVTVQKKKIVENGDKETRKVVKYQEKIRPNELDIELHRSMSTATDDTFHSIPETSNTHKALIERYVDQLKLTLDSYITKVDEFEQFQEKRKSFLQDPCTNNSAIDEDLPIENSSIQCSFILVTAQDHLNQINQLHKEYISLYQLDKHCSRDKHGTCGDTIDFEQVVIKNDLEKQTLSTQTNDLVRINIETDHSRKTAQVGSCSAGLLPSPPSSLIGRECESERINIVESGKEDSNLEDMQQSGDVVPLSTSFFSNRKVNYAGVVNSEKGIDIHSFVEACKEFAVIYDVLGGATFTPLKNDILGNVNKLNNHSTSTSISTLQLLVKHELETKIHNKTGSATDALVWLKRGLWLFSTFLQSIVNGERDPGKAFNGAYELKLKMHHNFIVQKLFKVGLLALPAWDNLIDILLVKYDKAETITKEQLLVQHVADYIKYMIPLLEELDQFYLQNGLKN